jgi:hypothetical protein
MEIRVAIQAADVQAEGERVTAAFKDWVDAGKDGGHVHAPLPMLQGAWRRHCAQPDAAFLAGQKVRPCLPARICRLRRRLSLANGARKLRGLARAGGGGGRQGGLDPAAALAARPGCASVVEGASLVGHWATHVDQQAVPLFTHAPHPPPRLPCFRRGAEC